VETDAERRNQDGRRTEQRRGGAAAPARRAQRRARALDEDNGRRRRLGSKHRTGLLRRPALTPERRPGVRQMEPCGPRKLRIDER
jgi:hypothetical protein